MNEEEDDGAFSNASDRNDYRGLMEETEHTQSVRQGNQDDEDDADDDTMESCDLKSLCSTSRSEE